MTLAITHAFISAKGDGTDATLVRPSNWNAGHATSMANGALLGNTSGGVGAIQELALSPFIAAILNAADAPTLLNLLGIGAFSTGDVCHTINPTPPAGWIIYQGTGTISDATGTGTVRANADCSALFQLIWNNISDTWCPVPGGRGASAVADFAAHKQITLPWFSGRTIVGAGSGGSLTTRNLAQYFGEESHALVTAELASHFHSASMYDPAHTHSITAGAVQGGGGTSTFINVGNSTTGASATGVRVNSPNGLDTTYSTGSGTAHNNMQPSIPMWTKVKL